MPRDAFRERPLIMVIDDDQPTVDLLSEVLQDEGYRTIECLRGSQAHHIIRREKPSLIILDMHLGGSQSGLTVLEILRLTPATTTLPIIVCTADTTLLKQKAYELQQANCEILEKPFDLDQLLKKVAYMSNVGQKKPRSVASSPSPSILRATKRLTQEEAVTGETPSLLRGSVSLPSAPLSEKHASQLEAQENEVSPLIAYSQQVASTSRLLINESQRLRQQSSNLMQETMSIHNQFDSTKWLSAMSGPQPRWLWRGRKSYNL